MNERRSLGVLLLALGCAAPPPEGVLCGTRDIRDEIDVWREDRVDLLFVVDGSASMALERDHLATEIPRMVRILASGDRDSDGVRDFDAIRSLHVGVVTADLGAPSGLAGRGAGDDALFVRSSVAGTTCGEERTSGIFSFTSGSDDADTLANDVRCTASAVIDRCGVEQPLESALRALSLSAPRAWTGPGYVPPVFADGSFGHGDGANAGFLRSDSVLAVVVLTDEDDCSVSDPGAELASADPSDADPSCSGAGRLLALERFVDGLLGLRTWSSLVVFSVIAGVPERLVDRGSSYQEILDAPEMQLTSDPTRPGQLNASCTRDGASATPPRRLVELAQAFDRRGAHTAVTSICGDSLAGAVDGIIETTSPVLIGRCMPIELEVDEEGRVRCELDAVLAPAESEREYVHCDQIEGVVRLGDELDHGSVREVCRLPALSRDEVVDGRVGWFYDDGDPRLGEASMLASGCGQNIDISRVSFNGSELRLRCLARSGDLPLCEE